MTGEELQRISQYADRIKAADNDPGVLTYDESLDLEYLVQKRINEGGGTMKVLRLIWAVVTLPYGILKTWSQGQHAIGR